MEHYGCILLEPIEFGLHYLTPPRVGKVKHLQYERKATLEIWIIQLECPGNSQKVALEVYRWKYQDSIGQCLLQIGSRWNYCKFGKIEQKDIPLKQGAWPSPLEVQINSTSHEGINQSPKKPCWRLELIWKLFWNMYKVRVVEFN